MGTLIIEGKWCFHLDIFTARTLRRKWPSPQSVDIYGLAELDTWATRNCGCHAGRAERSSQCHWSPVAARNNADTNCLAMPVGVRESKNQGPILFNTKFAKNILSPRIAGKNVLQDAHRKSLQLPSYCLFNAASRLRSNLLNSRISQYKLAFCLIDSPQVIENWFVIGGF